MKIDYLGTYRDISRVLERATINTPEKQTSGFSTLIKDLLPGTQKNANKTEGYVKTTPVAPEDDTPRARFAFPESLPFLPSLERSVERLVTPEVEKIGVKIPPAAPTIVSASRISTPSLTELTREQRISEVSQLVSKSAEKHGIDPALSMAIIGAESDFNPQAVSSDGFYSKGLFQLLDSTGGELHENAEEATQEGEIGEKASHYDPFNPEKNVELGITYLRKLHDLFSTETTLAHGLTTRKAENSSSLEKLAVAAFNAGEGRVASAQARAERQGLNPSSYQAIEQYLPESTKEYVQKVLNTRSAFKGELVG
jgi:soluble lytic murein transglycosylase-like protein